MKVEQLLNRLTDDTSVEDIQITSTCSIKFGADWKMRASTVHYRRKKQNPTRAS